MKTCTEIGCNNPRWSHGKCKAHNHLRTDDEYKRSLVAKEEKKQEKLVKAKETANKPVKSRIKRPRVIMNQRPASTEICFSTIREEAKQVLLTEKKLFQEIWDERPHISELSGKPINIIPESSLWYNCFVHLLAKGLNKYPLYKHYKPNIVLLTPEEHYLLDFGSIAQREKYGRENGCSWDKIYNLQKELKLQYPQIY